jgi:hypothetical protein
MASVLPFTDLNYLTRHQAAIAESFNHRLAVAQSNQNAELLGLLAQEQQQLTQSLPDQATVVSTSHLSLWQRLVQAFTIPQQLQVQRIRDRAGQLWWYAYDPQTGNTVYADSETEMRLWIEQNYPMEQS